MINTDRKELDSTCKYLEVNKRQFSLDMQLIHVLILHFHPKFPKGTIDMIIK